jgi:hypothetical protein
VDTTLKRAKRRRHIDYCEQHQEQLFTVGKSYKSKTRLRLAVSPIPSTGSHGAPLALISCTPSLRFQLVTASGMKQPSNA